MRGRAVNIFLRELRAHRKSLAAWALVMIFLATVGMTKYSAGLQAGGESLTALLRDMPRSLQNLFGVGVFDLSKALDYYAVMFLYFGLLASAHAVALGAEIIAKEERDHTAEFLLTKPVSRARVLLCKLAAAKAMLLIVNAVTFAASFFSLSQYDSAANFLPGLSKLMVAMFALQLFFMAVGVFFAGRIQNPKRSAGLATAVLFGTFILSIVTDMFEGIDFLRCLTPFQYFPARLLLKGGYSAAYPLLAVGIAAALVVGGFYFYRRRDLKN